MLFHPNPTTHALNISEEERKKFGHREMTYEEFMAHVMNGSGDVMLMYLRDDPNQNAVVSFDKPVIISDDPKT